MSLEYIANKCPFPGKNIDVLTANRSIVASENVHTTRLVSLITFIRFWTLEKTCSCTVRTCRLHTEKLLTTPLLFNPISAKLLKTSQKRRESGAQTHACLSKARQTFWDEWRDVYMTWIANLSNPCDAGVHWAVPSRRSATTKVLPSHAGLGIQTPERGHKFTRRRESQKETYQQLIHKHDRMLHKCLHVTSKTRCRSASRRGDTRWRSPDWRGSSLRINKCIKHQTPAALLS